MLDNANGIPAPLFTDGLPVAFGMLVDVAYLKRQAGIVTRLLLLESDLPYSGPIALDIRAAQVSEGEPNSRVIGPVIIVPFVEYWIGRIGPSDRRAIRQTHVRKIGSRHRPIFPYVGRDTPGAHPDLGSSIALFQGNRLSLCHCRRKQTSHNENAGQENGGLCSSNVIHANYSVLRVDQLEWLDSIGYRAEISGAGQGRATFPCSWDLR